VNWLVVEGEPQLTTRWSDDYPTFDAALGVDEDGSLELRAGSLPQPATPTRELTSSRKEPGSHSWTLHRNAASPTTLQNTGARVDALTSNESLVTRWVRGLEVSSWSGPFC
jgi:hypothetical protein